MKQLNIILNKNPLRFMFILSCLLHLIGFYCLYSLSYNRPVKKVELAPIKIKVIAKKEDRPRKKIKPEKILLKGTVNKNPDIKASELKIQSEPGISFQKHSTTPARPAQLTANALEFFSPRKLYRKSSQTASKHLPRHTKNTLVLDEIDFIENTTSASLHTQTINLRDLSSLLLRKKEPVHIGKFGDNNFDNSMTVNNSFVSNKLEGKTTPLYPRSPSKLDPDATLTHSPSRLVTQKIPGHHFDTKPQVRMAFLANEFSEKYIGANKMDPDLTVKSIKNEQASTLKLGRLRKGFVNQVRSKITKAKYYPRIARKLGFEGKPIVAFALGHKGELINLLLAQPSDHKVLNDAALETIRLGAPYPPIPEQLKENSINFKLPILYILEEH